MFGKNLRQTEFVSSGVRNWKKALHMFKKHETTQSHIDSVVCWNSYKASQSQGNVVQQIEKASATEITERREYLKRVVAVTCTLGKQGIAFRGHDEKTDSENKGNFIECMELLTQFDPFLQTYTPPSNTTYLSKASQNEMMECYSKEVTETTVREMKESGMYAIMADEARDSKTEQLALCVSYIVEGTVKERFLGLTELKEFGAKAICAAIEKELVDKGIDQLKCAAHEWGKWGGYKPIFRTNTPKQYMSIVTHMS